MTFEYLSPEQINEKHGKPTWKCWHCQAESNLYWYNGWSVAVCRSKPECENALSAFFKREIEAQEAYDAYGRELYGDAWDRR